MVCRHNKRYAKRSSSTPEWWTKSAIFFLGCATLDLGSVIYIHTKYSSEPSIYRNIWMFPVWMEIFQNQGRRIGIAMIRVFALNFYSALNSTILPLIDLHQSVSTQVDALSMRWCHKIRLHLTERPKLTTLPSSSLGIEYYQAKKILTCTDKI